MGISRCGIDYNRRMNSARYAQIAMKYPGENFAVSRFRAGCSRSAKCGDAAPRLIQGENNALYITPGSETGEPYMMMELKARQG